MNENWKNYFITFALQNNSEVNLVKENNLIYLMSELITTTQMNAIVDYSGQNIDDGVIKDVNGRYSSLGLDNAWNIIPGKSPSTLEKQLQKDGFYCKTEFPHMLLHHAKVDVRDLKQEILGSELQIKEITKREIEQFVNVVIKGFGFPMKIYEPYCELFKKIVIKKSEHKLFIGYLNNIPVSTSIAFYNSGLAGIYRIATLPEFRRKGLGRLMTIDLIVRAIDNEYSQSVLHASELGKPIYEKIGFEEIYKRKVMVKQSDNSLR